MTDRPRQFSYFLRPAKQVERKLLLQGLHRLTQAGYPINSYRYLGFGSIYYVDFLLFHKYLYIDDMVCVEHGPFPRAMRFNLPYQFIRLELKSLGTFIPELDRQRQHLVWLDYDYALNDDVLQDVGGVVAVVPPGSVVVVTVRAQPPEASVPGEGDACRMKRRKRILQKLQKQLGSLAPALSLADLNPARLAAISSNGLAEYMAVEAQRRTPQLAFHQLFSYRYADGANMVTVGGLIDVKGASAAIDEAVVGWPHAIRDAATPPEEIVVPWLTPREKAWFDQAIPVTDAPFELLEDELKGYEQFYREYPAYHESLL
jgi:hypothetical protein